MKTRRHHNNKGSRQIKRGKCTAQVERMARRLGIPYGVCGETMSQQEISRTDTAHQEPQALSRTQMTGVGIRSLPPVSQPTELEISVAQAISGEAWYSTCKLRWELLKTPCFDCACFRGAQAAIAVMEALQRREATAPIQVGTPAKDESR